MVTPATNVSIAIFCTIVHFRAKKAKKEKPAEPSFDKALAA